MTQFDTFLPGSGSSVHAAAEWMKPISTDATYESGDTADRNRLLSQGTWTGASASGYVGAVNAVYNESIEIDTHLRDAAEKLRAYAGQLDRMNSDLAGLRDEAREGGLNVVGTVIYAPTTILTSCAVPGDPDYPAYQRHVKQIELYNSLGTQFGTWWAELENWAATNITGYLSQLPTESDLDDLLKNVNEVARDFGVELPNSARSDHLNTLQEYADSMRAEAAEARAGVRSGNPAVRSAAEAVDQANLRRTASALDDVIPSLTRATRWVPGLGWVVEGIGFTVEVENGGSPSSGVVDVVFGTIGGIAAGAGAVALAGALGVTLPIWGTAAAVVAGGLAIGAGAVWAYENMVDQDIREAIDAGLGDAWEWTTDIVEGGWNWATGNG